MLSRSVAVFGGLNALGLAVSLYNSQEHRHIDILGTGAFVVAALAVNRGRTSSLHHQLSTLAVAAWGTRLAGFLGYRAFQTGHDARLGEILDEPASAAGFWAISMMWGVGVSLPHVLGSAAQKVPRFNLFSALAVGLFCAGMALETLADYQKWEFKAAGHRSFCDVGVWSASQHPNYAGNLMAWTGLYLLNFPLMSPTSRVVAAVTCPIFLVALFYGQSTGAIANTLQLADSKYGGDEKYLAYKAGTPLIFPGIPGA